MFWTGKSLWEGRIADALSNDRTCKQWQEREDANDFPVYNFRTKKNRHFIFIVYVEFFLVSIS